MSNLDAEWEYLSEEKTGMCVKPYLLTTAADSLAELEWSPSDARAAVRDMLSDPIGTWATTLAMFKEKTGGPGEPEQPTLRQKYAWPARAPEEDQEVFEDGAGGENDRNYFQHV